LLLGRRAQPHARFRAAAESHNYEIGVHTDFTSVYISSTS